MIKNNLVLVGLVAAGALAGLGVTASATDNPHAMSVLDEARQTLDDSLHDKVDTLLKTDMGLVGSEFNVVAKSGVVTLAGTVPDEHALRRAIDLASGVHGVREVRNSLEIGHPK